MPYHVAISVLLKQSPSSQPIVREIFNYCGCLILVAANLPKVMDMQAVDAVSKLLQLSHSSSIGAKYEHEFACCAVAELAADVKMAQQFMGVCIP